MGVIVEFVWDRVDSWTVRFQQRMSALRDFLDQLEGEAAVRKTDTRVVTEAEEFLSKQPFKKGQADPISAFIIEAYEEEMKRGAERRALRPDLQWGPSFRSQMLDARRDPRFRMEIASAMKQLKKELGDLTTHQLRVLAFVRVDRLRTERILEEAQRDGQVLRKGWSVCSPASLLAECVEERRFLFLEASRRGLMLQTKGEALQLMKRRGGSGAAGGT